MTPYESVFKVASQLPVADRLRLIDELSATVPDDQPPALSDEWLVEIERRSAELDAGAVVAESWEDVRRRIFKRVGLDRAG